MKKVFSIISLFVVLTTPLLTFASYSNDGEYVEAVERMFEKGMTKYQDANAFMPGDFVTREQAAKFFDVYVETIVGISKTVTEEDRARCAFSDEGLTDPTLKNHVLGVCLLSIMNGSQGEFRPTSQLTKAEAITVLVRITEGKLIETTNPRWENYHALAVKNGITKESNVWNLDKSLTRYEMALLLYRAAGNEYVSQGDAEIEEVESILSQLFGLNEE